MKPRTILLVLLALVCGVSAAVGVNQLNSGAPVSKDGNVPVVLVSQNIPRGGVLTEENCVLGEWPQNRLPAGAITNLEDAVNRTVTDPLYKNELVLEAKIASKDSGQGLASMIKPGMRAFTIQTPHVAAGVGGFIKPNDQVDVLLTTRSNSQSDGSGGGATTTLLQNVQILAVDRRLDKPEDQELADKDPRSVTLLVTPNQAAKLDLGMNMGMLHLSLRNPEDSEEAATRPATLADIRYHQEKPVSNLADKAASMAGVLARAWAARGETTTENTSAAAEQSTEQRPVEYRSANIRTLRGSSRGHIRIDTLP